MKRQDIAKLHHQTIDELEGKVRELQTELVEIKMKLALDQLKNKRQPKNLKTDIARILTIIKQKQLTGDNQKPEPKKSKASVK